MLEKIPSGAREEIFTGLPKDKEIAVCDFLQSRLGVNTAEGQITGSDTYFDVSETDIQTMDSGQQAALLYDIKAVVGDGYEVSFASRVNEETDEDEVFIFITPAKAS